MSRKKSTKVAQGTPALDRNGSDRATPTDPRTAILAAAIDILQREGAGALTVRSVAAAAGCSTTGVYTWFGGKNGLVEAIFIDGFNRFGAALEAVRRSDEQRHLTSQAEAYRDWALANPTHYMVMFGRAVPGFQPTPEARATARATFDAMVASTAEAIAGGRIVGDADDIAHFIWAGVHGYVSLELSGMDLHESAQARTKNFRGGLTKLYRGITP